MQHIVSILKFLIKYFTFFFHINSLNCSVNFIFLSYLSSVVLYFKCSILTHDSDNWDDYHSSIAPIQHLSTCFYASFRLGNTSDIFLNTSKIRCYNHCLVSFCSFMYRQGVRQGCILSPCLFNLHAEYIMQNTGLDEEQAGIKIIGRNSNNLRYTDDTILIGESKEELKSLLKVKLEGEKVGLKLNIQRMKIMVSSPITSWQIDGETVETVTDFIFLGSKKSLQMVTVAMKLKDACSLEEKLSPT